MGNANEDLAEEKKIMKKKKNACGSYFYGYVVSSFKKFFLCR